VDQNLPEAIGWYRKAADQGHARAQHYLGLKYYLGHGVSQDLEEAVRWLQKAADQGDPGVLNLLEVISKMKTQ
jgi:TPR repeat protein